MILLVDNYDSFVHNLARYLRELGEEVEVVRNDAIDPAGIQARAPSHLVLSPGPRTPAEAGVCVPAVRELGPDLPILGVCLGHQCVGAAYGARIIHAQRPMHGKRSRVRHEGSGLFRGLPDPLTVTRYHSLLVAREDLGSPLRVTAWTEAGEVMAVAHAEHPVWGVQFHPEAVLTAAGHALLANFLALGRGEPPPGADGVDRPSELEEPAPVA